jgi:hypothetical protein
MTKNIFKFLIIGFFWLFPILTYFNSPRTVDYALISLFIFIFSLLFLVSKFSKKFKIGTIEYIYLSLFLVSAVGLIFGFAIEANNLETGKKFSEFTWLDFIFPFSIISLASLPATYLISD